MFWSNLTLNLIFSFLFFSSPLLQISQPKKKFFNEANRPDENDGWIPTALEATRPDRSRGAHGHGGDRGSGKKEALCGHNRVSLKNIATIMAMEFWQDSTVPLRVRAATTC
jgi:hypothetical protein